MVNRYIDETRREQHPINRLFFSKVVIGSSAHSSHERTYSFFANQTQDYPPTMLYKLYMYILL